MSGDARKEPEVEHVLRVRTGHGANCSSIGSVVDTLFATAIVGSAIFAAVLGALKAEDVKVVSPLANSSDGEGKAGKEKDA